MNLSVSSSAVTKYFFFFPYKVRKFKFHLRIKTKNQSKISAVIVPFIMNENIWLLVRNRLEYDGKKKSDNEQQLFFSLNWPKSGKKKKMHASYVVRNEKNN